MADPLPPTPTVPAKKRARWGRRLGLLLVFLLLAVVAAPFALSLAPVRRYVAAQVSDAVGRKVTIGGISAAWWSGVDLRDVEVHNPAGYVGDPLLAVDHVHVDVAVWKAMTGTIDAKVLVEKPVLTLIRGANGQSNLDGLFPAERDAKARKAAKATPHVVLALRDGRMIAHGAPGAPAGTPDEVRDIRADVEVGAGTVAKLDARIVGAKAGGGDVAVAVDARLDAAGAGPVRATVPALDLARLAKAAAALGVDGLAGSLAANVDLVWAPVGGSGSATATLRDVAWRRGDGAVALKTATLEAKPTGAAAGMRIDLALVLEGLRATGFSKQDAGLDEPRLSVSGPIVRSPAGDLTFGDGATPLRIEGRVLSGTLSGSARGPAAGAASTEAVAKVAITLSPTLGRLLGVLASPDDDLRGAVTLDARMTSAGGPITWSTTGDVKGLVIGGADGATPYRDPSVVLDAAGTWDGAARTLRLTKATLSASAVNVHASPGFTLTTGDPARGEPLRVVGDATATVDLAAAARAFPSAFATKPGDRVAGRVEASVHGAATTAGGGFDVTLSGRDVWLPGATVAGAIDGKARVDADAARQTLAITNASLVGMGLDVRGGATLSTSGKGSALVTATADLTADLAAARPLLGFAAGLPPEATLAGTARGHVETAAANPGTRLSGTVTVERFRYTGARDPATGRVTTIEEPSVRLVPVVVFDAAPGLVRMDGTTLVSTTVTLTATKGSIRSPADAATDDAAVVDVALSVDGDLARVAEHLRTALGPSYDDAAGQGRLAGSVTVSGPTGGHGRDLRIAGDLTFARIGAGGITANDGRIQLSRPAPGTPLTATLTSQVNRGTLRVDGTCDLGRGESPWTAKVAIRGLDTSPMLTGKGAGKALTLVLPAIVPGDAASSALSGLLDADLDVRSSSLAAPTLGKTLTGPGSVRMTQGQVKDSTLFGALAGGGGGGKVLGMLEKLVPAVGNTLGELSRALLFQELSSTFTLGDERITLNPVVLVSPSVSLRFTGTVGFDGSGDLDMPLRLDGSTGKAIEPYLKDRTIPLAVRMRPNQPTRVTPKIDLTKLGGLPGLEKGKDLLEDLFKKKKPK